MRRFLGSPLIVVGKRLKLTRNRSVGHGLSRTKQSLCRFQVFPASLRNMEHHRALAWFSGASAIWNQESQLQSLARRALKQSTHFLEQRAVRHE
jgi:hypothetical protein